MIEEFNVLYDTEIFPAYKYHGFWVQANAPVHITIRVNDAFGRVLEDIEFFSPGEVKNFIPQGIDVETGSLCVYLETGTLPTMTVYYSN